METTNIRQKLHQLIDTLEDKKVEALYTLFENDEDSDLQRRKLIQAEREKYLRGEGKSFSWEEVKEMAVCKEKRGREILRSSFTRYFQTIFF